MVLIMRPADVSSRSADLFDSLGNFRETLVKMNARFPGIAALMATAG